MAERWSGETDELASECWGMNGVWDAYGTEGEVGLNGFIRKADSGGISSWRGALRLRK